MVPPSAKTALPATWLLTALSACTMQPAPPTDISAAANSAYIYGYPLVTMEMTRRVFTNVAQPTDASAPMGVFFSMKRYPPAADRRVTAPNPDMLYSTAWIDVGAEPYILHVPDEHGRYYMMPMLDGWTTVFAAPGKRTTGTEAGDFAITGPGWKGTLPKGIKAQYTSATDIVWLVGSTYSSGTQADDAEVNAIQAQYRLTPLGAWGKKYTPPQGKVDPSIDTKDPVRRQVDAMDGVSYFTLLATLMKTNPPVAEDAPMVATMAKIGLVPGQNFDQAKLSPDMLNAVRAAPNSAMASMTAHLPQAGAIENGWNVMTRTGVYGTDYQQRALIAAIGLGANRPEDAVYAIGQTDADGKPLDGANHYVLHFAKGQLPPVNAFWSLTIYDAHYFFAPNKLNRYTLSDRDKLERNSDGSVDFYLQSEEPGKAKSTNWLPVPAGAFIPMLRLYWPRERDPSVLNGSWQPPAVRRVP